MAIFKFTFKGEANFGWIRGNVLLALGGSLVKGGRDCQGSKLRGLNHGKNTTVGALIIRIGLWGILYYNYNKELSK